MRATFQSTFDAQQSTSILQYRSAAPVTPRHIVLHCSRFRCAWDWLILILTYYTAVMVPYNAAFHGKTADDIAQLAADSVVDVVFFVDVLLNCHTSFVATSGDVTRSRGQRSILPMTLEIQEDFPELFLWHHDHQDQGTLSVFLVTSEGEVGGTGDVTRSRGYASHDEDNPRAVSMTSDGHVIRSPSLPVTSCWTCEQSESTT